MPKTKLIGPADLPPVEVNVGKDGRSHHQPKQVPMPHLGLLWQRYMPAHDKLAANEVRTSGGADFSDIAEIKPRTRAANTWENLGGISWFVEWANSQLCDSRRVGLYNALAERRHAVIKGISATISTLMETRRRLVIAGATPATFENAGLAFEHTYGFPILPGSSLKGLARHFLEEEFAWDQETVFKPEEWLPLSPEPRDLASFLFGRTDTEAHEGVIAFYDAWPCFSVATKILDRDVLTVHHRKYYGGARIADDKDTPVPIYFLCVAPHVKFRIRLGLTAFGISQIREVGLLPLKFTLHVLKKVLWQWGIGARTGSGYGIMNVPST